MKRKLKRKTFNLDEKKIRRVQRILGAKTETDTIDTALDLVLLRTELLESLRKASAAGGVEKVF